MPHLFISHSSRDRTIAGQLCALLEGQGFECWIAPRDVLPGHGWAESIVEAIAESQLMIALVSESACRSRHIARELESADRAHVPVLPVRLDATPLQGAFQYFLGNRQWLDFTDRTVNDGEDDLFSAVRALSASPTDAPRDGARQPPPSPDAPRALERPGNTRTRVWATAVVAELRAVVMTLVNVALTGQKALAGTDLHNPGTLFFALRFLVYVSLASTILHIPAWAAEGIGFTHPAFMPLAVAEVLMEQLALCFLLYAALRLFGGQAEPLPFVCAFCLLGAYQLMSDVCLVPVQARAIAAQRPDIDQFLARVVEMGDHASIGELAVILVGTTASMGLRVVFLVSLFRAFHLTEQLGRFKAGLTLLVGIGLWLASVLVIGQRFQSYLYEAFRTRG